MHLLGFEPRTSRVWSERDNQLHHRCNCLHEATLSQIWLCSTVRQHNSKNIKNVPHSGLPSVAHSALWSPCSPSSGSPSRTCSHTISSPSPFPSPAASTSTESAPAGTRTEFLSEIQCWDCCPASSWTYTTRTYGIGIVSSAVLWLQSAVAEYSLYLPRLASRCTERKPVKHCCGSCCCCSISAPPVSICSFPVHLFLWRYGLPTRGINSRFLQWCDCDCSCVSAIPSVPQLKLAGYCSAVLTRCWPWWSPENRLRWADFLLIYSVSLSFSSASEITHTLLHYLSADFPSLATASY